MAPAILRAWCMGSACRSSLEVVKCLSKGHSCRASLVVLAALYHSQASCLVLIIPTFILPCRESFACQCTTRWLTHFLLVQYAWGRLADGIVPTHRSAYQRSWQGGRRRPSARLCAELTNSGRGHWYTSRKTTQGMRQMISVSNYYRRLGSL